MFVTSDASTLLKELEVEHPAAKMLVMAAEMQHQEVGDFANFVVTFAGELLSHAESLLRLVRFIAIIKSGCACAFSRQHTPLVVQQNG